MLWINGFYHCVKLLRRQLQGTGNNTDREILNFSSLRMCFPIRGKEHCTFTNSIYTLCQQSYYSLNQWKLPRRSLNRLSVQRRSDSALVGAIASVQFLNSAQCFVSLAPNSCGWLSHVCMSFDIPLVMLATKITLLTKFIKLFPKYFFSN